MPEKGFQDLMKQLDDIGSEIDSKKVTGTDASSSIPQVMKLRRMAVINQSEAVDIKQGNTINSQGTRKKKVVMISPTRTNSFFPDLESSFSRQVQIIPQRTDSKKRPLGILKTNTRIPLDFKKDYMGVMYSPILENRHATITADMEKKDAERYGRWDDMMNHLTDGWDSSVSLCY